jgi:type II secretory pathway pseudopilin PulG
MTLVELMVSVGVLVLLMMIFSQILSSAQRVSIKSNSLVQSNSATTAIAQLLREDVHNLDPNGFLVITPDANSPTADPNAFNYRNCLSFAAIGMCVSASDPAYKANEAVISYGQDLIVNNANSCMWRKGLVLVDSVPAGTLDPNQDWAPLGLNYYMDTLTPAADPNTPAAGSLEDVVRTPPPSGIDWREMDNRCVAFKVYWWDNTNKTWDASPKTWKTGDTFPEALRITFTLCMDETELSRYRSDPNYRPRETREFEVICPIRP